MHPIRTITAASVAVVLGAAGCSGGDGDDPAGPGSRPMEVQFVSSLERFDSCDELRDWAHDELAPRVGAYGFSGGGYIEGDMPADATEAEADAEVDAEQGGGDEGFEVEEDVAEAPTDSQRSAEPLEPQAEGPDAATSDSGTSPSDADTEASTDAGADQSANGAAADGDAGSGDVGSPGYSETNVQVEGVDEPDIVKTDGDHILALAGGRLNLASAADETILDSIELPQGMYDGEMMLSGDSVLVFESGSFEIMAEEGTAGPVIEDGAAVDAESDVIDEVPPVEAMGTRVAQIDIEGDQLVEVASFELDGNYISARMIDGVVRLVLHAEPHQRLPFVTPATGTAEAEQQARELNQDIVREAEAEDFLPQWRQLGDGGDEGTLVGCDQAHAPERFAGMGMVTVLSIDMSQGLSDGIASANGAGVMANAETVYASSESLYIAAPQWVDPEPIPVPQDGAEEPPVPEEPGTDIHKFDISDPTQAVYEMSGWVDGYLLNQFAMNEHDGNLQVATTTGDAWQEGEQQSESQVVVLAPGEEALQPIGSVSGLGRGESIYSVRFMGDVGYVVTFRETDPLYTIDLSDPANPRQVGELEMLGYSAYLHPIDENHLLGVGQDASDTGATQGTMVSLFDVSDPADPTRVAETTLAGGSSEAEWDHRAFLWWPDTKLAAIPVSIYDTESFEGLVGFEVDVEAASITEIGRVAHPGQTDDDVVPLPEPRPSEDVAIDVAPPEDYYYSPYIVRSLVIGDRLWTLSNEGLASSDLATLGDTRFVPF